MNERECGTVCVHTVCVSVRSPVYKNVQPPSNGRIFKNNNTKCLLNDYGLNLQQSNDA